jgi:hypothetical protein
MIFDKKTLIAIGINAIPDVVSKALYCVGDKRLMYGCGVFIANLGLLTYLHKE